MSTIRIGIYIAIITGAGLLAWMWTNQRTTSNATGATPPDVATPIPTIDATIPTPTTTIVPSATPGTEPAPTSQPAPSLSTVTASSVDVVESTVAVTFADGAEGFYTGDEPASVATEFIATAWTDCWNCDPDFRQSELSRLATSDVAANWPAMGPGDVARFLVRTVEFGNVTVTNESNTVEVDVTVTEQSSDGTVTTTYHGVITISDALVTAATFTTTEPGP